MGGKKSGRTGDSSPVRSRPEVPAPHHDPGPQAAAGALNLPSDIPEKISREDTPVMPAYGLRTPAQPMPQQAEGVTVIGEAIRRVPSEAAEFLIEAASSAPTAAQALRENQTKISHIAQSIAPAGVQPSDVETISMKVQNLFAPLGPALPQFGLPQIGMAPLSPQAAYPGFHTFAGAQAAQPEMQLGSYVASKTLRVVVRDPARMGDAADAAARAGATILGGFRLRAADESGARKAALEAAGKDARAKAEALAAATGRQIGDPISISEDIVATNGVYTALRANLPFGFGAGAPEQIGDLEYYARVSVNFRLA